MFFIYMIFSLYSFSRATFPIDFYLSAVFCFRKLSHTFSSIEITRRWEIKTLYKPLWRDMFKRHRDELKEFDRSWLARVRFALSHERSKRYALLPKLLDSRAYRGRFLKQQEIERVNLSLSQKGRTIDASREVHKAYQYDRDKLREMHKADNENRKDQAKTTTDEIWKKQRDTSANDFDAAKDRRQSDQKADREFVGDDQEKIDKMREFKRKQAQKALDRKRNRSRSKGRGRERDF
jgi:hypothetical protein